jgi:hypothetical protein
MLSVSYMRQVCLAAFMGSSDWIPHCTIGLDYKQAKDKHAADEHNTIGRFQCYSSARAMIDHMPQEMTLLGM